MFFNTVNGKKIISVLAAVSAFVVIQTAHGLTTNAASALPEDGAPSVSYAAAPASGASASYGKGVVTTQYLNVRKERSTDSTVVGVLKKNSVVNLLEKKDGWYKVKVSEKTGWISADYVKVTSNTSSTTTTAAAKTTAKATAATKAASATSDLGSCTVTVDYLNVRSGAGTNYSLAGVLTKGKTVKVLDQRETWSKVQLSSTKTGWVMNKYVKFGSSGSASSATTTKKTTSQKSNSSSASTSSTGKITITADILNARAGATTSSAVVGTVRRNEVYTYTAVKNNWYKITVPSGATAYVRGDYVKPFSDYAIKGGGSYLWPTQSSSRISSRFGPRDGRNHYGIDIAAPGGSQIMAVASGKVIKKAYEANGFGNYIVIQQSDGICAYYGHMKSPSFLKVGASVKAGDTVGLVGSTGRSTGNHLHLEFRRGTTRINPLNYYPNMK